MPLRKKPVENIVIKGQNAGYQHFLLFLQYFLPYETQILCFEKHLLSANAINFDMAKILSSGKRINHYKLNPK